MHPQLRPHEIENFSRAIGDYFLANTGERAIVRPAFRPERGGSILWNDFNGMIEVSGDYIGSICFSAPRVLLSHVLLKTGESVFTEERHGDIVGEIANALADAARRSFGDGISISPPRLLDYSITTYQPLTNSLPKTIAFMWHGYEASLVIHLEARRKIGENHLSTSLPELTD
jgi:chemotaxis protein CheX